MKVAIYHTPSTKDIAEALYQGVKNCGHKGEIEPKSSELYDVVAFYGMSPEHVKLYKSARDLNKPVVIVDLGYLARTKKNQNYGHVKVSVNYLHPQAFMQRSKHANDRFNKLNISIKPMQKTGDQILLAGIGHKSSIYYNIKHQSWDMEAAITLRKHTKRPIVYRAKPGNHANIKLAGTAWSDPYAALDKALNGVWAIVTHHSNVAIDGLIRGIPCFVKDGAPILAGLTDLSKIESPRILTYKEQMQFFYDLAYVQWTLDEISSGQCWRHLEHEGLITDRQP